MVSLNNRRHQCVRGHRAEVELFRLGTLPNRAKRDPSFNTQTGDLVCANTPFSVLFIVHLSMGGERVVRGGERVVRGGERVVRGGERVVRGGERVAVQTKIDGQKER